MNENKATYTQEVSTKNIYGKGKNLYLVCWSRCANFGYDLIRADSEEEAYKHHGFSANKEVNYIITNISCEDMPVIFKGGQ